MVIGILQIELELPGCNSLKEKRKVLNRIRDRVHHRFNVSIAETDAQDLWNYAELGVAVVANEQPHANEVISKIARYLESLHDYVLVDIRTEFIQA